MQPTVKQYLSSIHKTIVEQIVPHVSGNAFVAEQAGLIVASLEMLMEVQPYEDDYLRMELHDLQQSLAILGAPERATAASDRHQLQRDVQGLKQQLHDRLESLAAANGGMPAKAVLEKLHPQLERQQARELAWTRLTGFHPHAATLPHIHDVLTSQRNPA